VKEALKCRRYIARCLLFLARLTGRNVCDVDFQEIISFFNSVWDAKKCVLEQVRSGIHKIKNTFCAPEFLFKEVVYSCQILSPLDWGDIVNSGIGLP
jgi:hypothetical protein